VIAIFNVGFFRKSTYL